MDRPLSRQLLFRTNLGSYRTSEGVIRHVLTFRHLSGHDAAEYRPGVTDRPPSPSAESSGDPLDTSWTRLAESWEDDDAHRAFVGLASTLGRLPDAARLYREVRDVNDARRPKAEKQLGAITMVAFEQLKVTGSRTPAASRKATQVAGVLIAFAFIGFALTQLRRLLE